MSVIDLIRRLVFLQTLKCLFFQFNERLLINDQSK